MLTTTVIIHLIYMQNDLAEESGEGDDSIPAEYKITADHRPFSDQFIIMTALTHNWSVILSNQTQVQVVIAHCAIFNQVKLES